MAGFEPVAGGSNPSPATMAQAYSINDGIKKRRGVMTQDAVTVASLLTSAGSNISAALTQVWSIITSNDLLQLSVGASILSLGFAFFRKARRTARG